VIGTWSAALPWVALMILRSQSCYSGDLFRKNVWATRHPSNDKFPRNDHMDRQQILTRRVRWLIAFLIIGLVLSGLTAFPLETELDILARMLGISADASPDDYSGLRHWIAKVREGIVQTNADYPFMAYGTDWLAFAHLIIAVAFIGPLRDPVRNIWVIEFGLIACVAVIPTALICGAVRGIPFYWQLIDCSFGIIAFVPLWLCRCYIKELELLASDEQ